ncbi:helicase associated domain-containing protein [Streptomyces sp. NPDC050528]|uniref:helicase associated domain-containing protein n=1 Tax=Streptomyces sp. NPDC050528 TaxID=3365623 RepID=UPI0037A4C9B5
MKSYESDDGAACSPSSMHRVLTGAEEQRAQQSAGMLEFMRERPAWAVADWLRIRMVNDPAAGEMLRVVEAATVFQERHGHLRVPGDWEEGGIRLAEELDRLRRNARADTRDLDRLSQHLGGDHEAARAKWLRDGPRVHPDLMHYLAEMGFVWNPRSGGRALLLAAARAYADTHGHLLPRRGERVTVGGDAIPIGVMLAERRRLDVQDAEMDAIGVWRVPAGVPWTAAWHRQLVRLRLFKAEGGTRADLLGGPRIYRGGDLGKWLQQQHVRWKELREAQRTTLADLQMEPVPDDTHAPGSGPQVRRSRIERCVELVTAARQHLVDVGPLADDDGRIIVADSYRPVIAGREVQLRKRLYPVRDGFSTYPPEMQALFVGLGLLWAQPAAAGTESAGPGTRGYCTLPSQGPAC